MKGQPAADLGLPAGWRFTFDDPGKCSLVHFDRIIAPWGMKLISPDGRQFNSLQSAFAHMQHSNVEDAIQLVETFLKRLGSSQYTSRPDNFLVDKDFCMDFMSDAGSKITMFGRIVGCMKSISTPSPEVSKDDNTFFFLQYRRDAVDSAKNSGIHVAPLQLIQTATAWGGCISFERKTMTRHLPKGVIAGIDQATPVSFEVFALCTARILS